MGFKHSRNLQTYSSQRNKCNVLCNNLNWKLIFRCPLNSVCNQQTVRLKPHNKERRIFMHPFYFYFLPVKMILTVLSGMTQSLFAHVCHCLFENVCMYVCAFSSSSFTAYWFYKSFVSFSCDGLKCLDTSMISYLLPASMFWFWQREGFSVCSICSLVLSFFCPAVQVILLRVSLYLTCSCLAVCTKHDWSVSFRTSWA